MTVGFFDRIRHMASPGTPQPDRTDAESFDLFLSYNSGDRGTVLQVRQELALRHVSSFFDRADLTPGRPWFDELEAAMQGVRGVAVFIGKDGLGTIQKREMQFALARQSAQERRGRIFPVIPVLLDGADPDRFSGFLALNTWVDLRQPTKGPDAFDSVVRALRAGAESAQAGETI